MKLSRTNLLFLFLILLVGGGIWISSKLTTHAVAVLVQTGSIRDSVTGNVRVFPESSFELRSQSQGKAEFVRLQPFGKPVEVEEEEILIRLETKDLNRSLEQAQLAQKTHLERMELGSALALQLKIERQELESIRVLAGEKKVSLLELNKKQNLVERLQVQLENEKLNWEEIRKNHEFQIADLEAQLQRNNIRSPIDGKLVTSFVTTGDMVFGGSVIGQVISKTRLIEVTLNEEEFAGIREGQEAAVTLYTFGRRIFEAEVSRLSATIDSNTGRRKLYLSINSDIELPTGGSGRAEIVKGVRENTLIIPRKALLGNSVLVVQNGLASIREVRIGASNLNEVEILEGLEAEDQVIVDTPHLYGDGHKVTVSVIEVQD